MTSRMGKIKCRLGRHEHEYWINADRLIVIIWCPRCRNPKTADAFDAKPLQGHTAPPADQRQLPESEELRTTIAMLKAVSLDDPEAIMLLSEQIDKARLAISWVRLLIDALAEPSSVDLEGYTQRAFERLGSPPK